MYHSLKQEFTDFLVFSFLITLGFGLIEGFIFVSYNFNVFVCLFLPLCFCKGFRKIVSDVLFPVLFLWFIFSYSDFSNRCDDTPEVFGRKNVFAL